MTTSKSTPLFAAAQARSQQTRHRAEEALRALDAKGIAVTFAAVAVSASVSRSWLYRDGPLRTEIKRLRDRPSATVTPSAQRASGESLRRQRDALLDEIVLLKKENLGLRTEVARLLGERRHAAN